MATVRLVRFAVRADARLDAERAMHDFATYVRASLPATSWTVYRTSRDYLTYIRADSPAALAAFHGSPGRTAFVAALAPLLDGEIEELDCELVTSSDLQRRRR